MAKRFDKILDDCITRITLQGETVEACLALYPDEAAALEPELRTVVAAAGVSDYIPSAAAKDRGRLLLRAERNRLEAAEATLEPPSNSWVARLFRGRARWAVAAAAVLVLMIGGGMGTVAAADGSAPGDLLYPVKRASEKVRLTFTFSEESKAKLRLAYAERRAQEISKLVSAGKTSLLQPTQENLDDHVTTVARIVTDIQDAERAERLRSELQTSASRALAAFQAAVREAPEVSRAQADDTLEAVGSAYGVAIEKVALPTTDEGLAAAPGLVQFRAADPPPPGIERVLVQLRGIEVYRAGIPEGRWIIIAREPQTFDLLRIGDFERFLGEQTVAPGVYTRVRFHIEGVTVVANGAERHADVSSRQVTLIRPFRVESGKVTVVLLGFHGMHLLPTEEQDSYQVAPDIKVFAEEPTLREEPSSDSRLDTSAAVDAHVVTVEVEGLVQKLGRDALVVQRKLILLAPDVEIYGKLEVGRMVIVEAVVRPDHTFVARRIEVK